MKRIIILGNKGMLGHIIEKYAILLNKYDVIGLNRENGFNAINPFSLSIKTGDIIINCIGILNNSDDIHLYSNINIVFPKIMQHLCKKSNAKFIHISTNCVFNNIGPNFVNDTPNATDLYGISKYMGEIIDNTNLTVRTSIIGTEIKNNGIGLIEQFINNDNFDTGFVNVFWNGVTTLKLAEFIFDNLSLTGIHHYFTKNPINKYDLLKLINHVFEVNKEIKKGYSNMHQSLLNGNLYCNIDYLEQLKQLKQFNEY